jgi:hypothetical protein
MPFWRVIGWRFRIRRGIGHGRNGHRGGGGAVCVPDGHQPCRQATGDPVLQPYAGDLAARQLSDTNCTTLTLGASVSLGAQVLAPELEADEEWKIRTVVDRLNTNVCPAARVWR